MVFLLFVCLLLSPFPNRKVLNQLNGMVKLCCFEAYEMNISNILAFEHEQCLQTGVKALFTITASCCWRPLGLSFTLKVHPFPCGADLQKWAHKDQGNTPPFIW